VTKSGIIRALALAMALVACRDTSGPGVGTVPARIVVISGVELSGYVAGTRIATPIAVKVLDAADRPVPGIDVFFDTRQQRALVLPNPVTTGQDGIARTYWTLGMVAGADTLMISVPATPSIPEVDINTTTVPGAVAFVFIRAPFAVTLAQGTTRQFSGGGADSNGNLVDKTVVWASSNPTAVSVSSTGLVTASAPGNAFIIATVQGISDSAVVTVPVPAGPGGPGIPPFTLALSAQQDFGITVVRSDGTVESRISCGGQCNLLAGPNWSRDGSKLAVTGRRDTLSVLFVVNRDGTNLHEIASAPRVMRSLGHGTIIDWPEFNEDWSTDGRLVYVQPARTGSSIEIAAADGTGRSTVLPATDPIMANDTAFAPRWGLGDTMISAVIGNQIYVMNPDGSNLRPLTSPGEVGEPIWSPDGKSLAFIPQGTPDQTQRQITVIDPVSGSLRRVLVPSTGEFCWAPTSSSFSLVSSDNWGVLISTVNLDGSSLRQAVIAINELSYRTTAAFSPDAKFLVYMDYRWSAGAPSVGAQLYAQGVDTGTNTRISDMRDVIFFSIAETRGCGRSFYYP